MRAAAALSLAAAFSFKCPHRSLLTLLNPAAQAKTHAECYDYLFALAARMAAMGLDASAPGEPPPPPIPPPA
jgi:hypothetical protein